MRLGRLAFVALLLIVVSPLAAAPARTTQNVVFVTMDGFRWQEIFGGANDELIHDTHATRDNAAVVKEYWRDTPQERRAAMMPFLWNTIAKQGQIFGDRESRCIAHTANDRKFSYPGYSEMLCGIADPRIDSNDPVPNPNPNVLEFLDHRPGFVGKVAAYGTWDVLNAIVNEKRSGFFVHSGWAPLQGDDLSPAQREVNLWMHDLPHLWPDNTFDAISERLAMEHLRLHHPRVLYLMFGETDEWAHMGRYDCYLRAATLNDASIAQLWKTLQSDPQYAGKTTLVLTTDHGRGATAQDWKNHGHDVAGAEGIWIAIMGPDTPALGVRKDITVTQSQIAATLAELLGEDFHSMQPKAADPLSGVMSENP